MDPVTAGVTLGVAGIGAVGAGVVAYISRPNDSSSAVSAVNPNQNVNSPINIIGNNISSEINTRRSFNMTR